jgi:hypothetical protein
VNIMAATSPASLAKLEWIEGAQDRPAPGQLGNAMDFLSVGPLHGGQRRDLWKWQGYRSDRAPHGFEGVCRTRADAARAAETAYFGD